MFYNEGGKGEFVEGWVGPLDGTVATTDDYFSVASNAPNVRGFHVCSHHDHQPCSNGRKGNQIEENTTELL